MEIKHGSPSAPPHTYDLEKTLSKSSDKVVIINSSPLSSPDIISIKAQLDDKSVGQTVFTPVLLITDKSKIRGMAIEQLWAHQGNQDIAAILVNKGFEILRKKGCPFVVVIGKQNYYSRFGFENALKYNITNQAGDTSENTLMIHFITHIPDRNISGKIQYNKELDIYYN